MVHRTHDFEIELRRLEKAQKLAKNEEIKLKQQVRAAKYRSSKVNVLNEASEPDLLTVIATPSTTVNK